jgi:hypothetical protein
MSSIKVSRLFNSNSTTETLQLNADGTSTIGATSKGTVRTIDTSWDLATGNFWECGAIDIPSPTNAAPGTSGIIRFTAAPLSWSAECSFVGGNAYNISAFPAICSFYVQASDNVMIGPVNEGYA